MEPARGGFYAGPPPFDVSHAELACTARDYHRFLRMLVERGRVEGAPVISGCWWSAGGSRELR